jgi:hypothetical protein
MRRSMPRELLDFNVKEESGSTITGVYQKQPGPILIKFNLGTALG